MKELTDPWIVPFNEKESIQILEKVNELIRGFNGLKKAYNNHVTTPLGCNYDIYKEEEECEEEKCRKEVKNLLDNNILRIMDVRTDVLRKIMANKLKGVTGEIDRMITEFSNKLHRCIEGE